MGHPSPCRVLERACRSHPLWQAKKYSSRQGPLQASSDGCTITCHLGAASLGRMRNAKGVRTAWGCAITWYRRAEALRVLQVFTPCATLRFVTGQVLTWEVVGEVQAQRDLHGVRHLAERHTGGTVKVLSSGRGGAGRPSLSRALTANHLRPQ